MRVVGSRTGRRRDWRVVGGTKYRMAVVEEGSMSSGGLRKDLVRCMFGNLRDQAIEAHMFRNRRPSREILA